MTRTALLASVGLCVFGQMAVAAEHAPRPMFARGINRHDPVPGRAPLGGLPTWNFTWTYNRNNYSATFVGNPPTGAAVSVPVYIIPIALTYNGTTTDPTKADYTGNSPVKNIQISPILQSGITYNQGGTNLGNTQYEDAFQRANLWGTVKNNPNYHVLLSPVTVEPVQSLTVPNGQGSVANEFGVTTIIANINWLDPILQGLLTSLNIPANSLPLFITTQTYLSSDGTTATCCIGGYHSYTGTQAYSHATYISKNGGALAFSQDVSALSHEIGEWVDDPLTNNTNVPFSCATHGNGNQIYEVGDPLEVVANYGDYAYSLNGLTWHLQDMVMPTYFGAPKSTSIPYNQSFQGHRFSVCQNGG